MVDVKHILTGGRFTLCCAYWRSPPEATFPAAMDDREIRLQKYWLFMAYHRIQIEYILTQLYVSFFSE